MTKPTTEPSPEHEQTAEYREGREARKQNRPDSDNPYNSAEGRGTSVFSSRFRWYVGWYDENTAALLKRQAERRLQEAAEAATKGGDA